MLSSALRCLASMNLFLLALGLVAQLHGRTCAYHSGPQFLAQHRNNQTERNRDLDTLKGGSGSAWVTKLEGRSKWVGSGENQGLGTGEEEKRQSWVRAGVTASRAWAGGDAGVGSGLQANTVSVFCSKSTMSVPCWSLPGQ